MSSPKLLRNISSRGRYLRVLVLGQPAVGKTALTVRFVTRRFIGEYDPTLERRYRVHQDVDGESIGFEIFDTAGQFGGEEDNAHIEERVRWADAFILVFSVADRCSFDEITRLKFLINHSRKSRGVVSNSSTADSPHLAIALVGNKNDLESERMVSTKEGRQLCSELRCSGFYDISVRESYDQALQVFVDLFKFIKQTGQNKVTTHRRAFRHQNAITDSPPSPRHREGLSILDSPPSPRRRVERTPVLGISKDELSVMSNTLTSLSPQPAQQLSPDIDWRGSSTNRKTRKKSISKRIIGKMITSLSSSSKDTDSFRSDSDLTE